MFSAAVTASGGGTLSQTAVYKSLDGGATWLPVFTAANSNGKITAGIQTTIKLAAGTVGTLAVGVVKVSTGTAVGFG